MADRGPIGLGRLERMAAMQQHRGPDEAGIYVDDAVGLVSTRLSIIDLAGGTQPIHNEDRTKWIVLNGEVFNYPELRADLEADGHRFYTTSDTEVILHAFEAYGPDCLAKFNGQFAFAIWDTNQQVLFLARDRVGIRPLHYALVDGRLYFASEIKSLFVNPEIPRRLDAYALDQIFTVWTTLAGHTVFENVYELPPGHHMVVRGEHLAMNRYWELPFAHDGSYMDADPADLVEEIRELLLDAIRIRLRAEVPVATYLSGGLDSSGVTALVKKNFNNRLRSFGIRFEEKGFDEGDFQREMVDHLGIDHQQVTATNRQIGDVFADVLWHCESPLLRTSPAPLYLLSDLVHRSGFKVVLTGEGADEVFAGYNIFREAKVRRFWARQPDSEMRPLLLRRLYPYILNDPKLKHVLKSFFGAGLDRADDPFFSHFLRWRGTERIKALFSPALKERIGRYDVREDLLGRLPADFHRFDHLGKAQYLEMSIFLSNYLLSSQGDRVAMAHSVEIRLPYLDYRVIEMMGRVNPAHKIRGLNEKALLKTALAEVLPLRIAQRDKQPYRAPIQQCLLNDRGPSLFSRDAIEASGLFDAACVARLVNKLERSERASEFDAMALSGVLSTQVVYDRFVRDFRSEGGTSVRLDILVDRRTTGKENEE